MYSDALRPLVDRLGARIRRASRVEVGDDNRFYGDLAPVGGPRLGPYPTYGEAVAAERAWLESNLDRVLEDGRAL